MKIIIGSAHAGGGHNSLAKSINSALSKFPEKYQTEIYHVQGKKAGIYYRMFGLKMFNAFYRKTNNLVGREVALLLVDKLVIREIKKRIAEINPDLVLSVFPFYGQTLSKLNIPYITFVADPFYFHSIWADTEAKYLVVFSDEAKRRAKKLFVPEEKIISCRFPVRKDFFENASRTQLKSKYQLDPGQFVITLGGSGDGMEKSYLIAKSLHKTKLNFKIYVLCGRNVLLRTRLKARLYLDKRFEVIGFTEKLSDYLKMSDLFVGKAGPNILFECLTLNVPILATPPLLAQEDSNREFIIKNGIGWAETNTHEISSLITKLISNPGSLFEKKAKMSKISSLYVCPPEEFDKLIYKLCMI